MQAYNLVTISEIPASFGTCRKHFQQLSYPRPPARAKNQSPRPVLVLGSSRGPFRETTDKCYGLFLKCRIKLRHLDTLYDEIVIQRSRRMVCLDELPVLLGHAGEFRDNDVLGTWCDSENLPTINFDFPIDCPVSPVGWASVPYSHRRRLCKSHALDGNRSLRRTTR